MTVRHLCAPGLVAGALAAWVVGCSSKGSGLPDGDDASDDGTGSTSGGGSSSSSSSGGSGSGSGSSSGHSSSSGSSGSGSGGSSSGASSSSSGCSDQRVQGPVTFTDAGVPTCGTTPCDLTKNICCVNELGQGSCIPNTQSCASLEAAFECLQESDCPSGQICCGVADSTTMTAGSKCEDVSSTGGQCTPAISSTQGSAQLCQTSCECKNGMTCSWQVCSVGGLSPQFTMCGLQSEAPFNCTEHQ